VLSRVGRLFLSFDADHYHFLSPEPEPEPEPETSSTNNNNSFIGYRRPAASAMAVWPSASTTSSNASSNPHASAASATGFRRHLHQIEIDRNHKSRIIGPKKVQIDPKTTNRSKKPQIEPNHYKLIKKVQIDLKSTNRSEKYKSIRTHCKSQIDPKNYKSTQKLFTNRPEPLQIDPKTTNRSEPLQIDPKNYKSIRTTTN
jgi:hypothetical protein